MSKQAVIEKIAEVKSRKKPLVFTRVTGYYRAVSNFNEGKQAEFSNRLEYKVA
jgi:anaerobic ribonucleoside-triphosphate reductase